MSFFQSKQTDCAWSLTPRTANCGEGLAAGVDIGADTKSMECAWWALSMQLPSRLTPNVSEVHPMFFDYYHPHSLCINREGSRFANESSPYNQFGQAMLRDQQKTGANVPCWLIFDQSFRRKYACGPILPSAIMPDRKLPLDWWDSYLFRAGSVGELAEKIGIDHDTFLTTIMRFNKFAEVGDDVDFGRGKGGFDVFFGDADNAPNPCFGSVETPLFYVMRIDLGDLGTKGGLKTDSKAHVMSKEGETIEGLYAVGNCAGSPFSDCYPGGGGMLGPAWYSHISQHTIFFHACASHRRANRQADRAALYLLVFLVKSRDPL